MVRERRGEGIGRRRGGGGGGGGEGGGGGGEGGGSTLSLMTKGEHPDGEREKGR